jgi:Mg-chelatase subunit ChlD
MLFPSFIHPEALWLLLLLLPIWALALASPRTTAAWRFWSSLGLRSALLVVLVLALAGTQIVSRVENLTTVFLIDSSDSVSPSSRGRAEAFVQDALNTMREDDRAALVVFGENALVERAPSDNARLGRLTSVPMATRTNIEEAIQLGLALFPADSQKRLVLLSDGGENSGQATTAARLAAARGIPIDVVDVGGAVGSDEALVTGMDVPNQVRDGQEMELTVSVESTVEQPAQLRIFADQDIIVDRSVQLASGTNEFRTTIEVSGNGFRRYRAQIEPEHDERVQNNEVAAMVQIKGPPSVLLVAGQRNESRNLAAALASASITAEQTTPEEMPVDLTTLSAYEAVVLVNVPARDLPVEAMAAIPSYVRDLGRGLIMIGGEESYGVGGYGRTPIEEALPVYMDVRDREQRPNLAIVFIIDKSGSMDACHCSDPDRRTGQLQQGGDRKVDIAKDAIYQATALLGSQDTISIVTFDADAENILPPTTAPSPDEVADVIAEVEPLGNTNVRAGLQEAEEVLRNTDARIKHAVLLTDGWGGGGSGLDLAEKMHDQGMTLSVVAAGGGSAEYLENLAIIGGGRYYPAQDMSKVPEIFLQETIMASGNYIVEKPFVPMLAGDSPVLKGLEGGVPILHGYNGSTLKDTARSVLVSDEETPILAQWQYGLGRSIAWTSDAKGKWAREWVAWDAFPRFASQMVGWVLPGQSGQQVITEVQGEGSQVIISSVVRDDEGEPLQDDLQMQALLFDSAVTDSEEDSEQQTIEMKQVAPGEYRATIPSPLPGTYLLQLRGQHDDSPVVQDVAGLVVPYSPEYRQNQANPALLAEMTRLTAGQHLQEPERVFIPTESRVARAQEVAWWLMLLALILLPFDIAIRRLLLRRRDLVEAHAWVSKRLPLPNRTAPAAPAAPDPTLSRLSQAKQRAAAPRQAKPATPPPEMPTTPAPPPPAPAAPEQKPKAAAQPATTAPPPHQEEVDPMERLRRAKERVRRRTRGDE